ncbi:hypothetical protein FGIG_10238 [Fasciola gigantica]|uniref:Uncharacterized protein n=2 Tax=Fasciola gigantica TaxID=46835 RepID=A0A504ZEI5_FASGI|nr:hypothetical protein FGIG_10238 [Fasciola gigantica]
MVDSSGSKSRQKTVKCQKFNSSTKCAQAALSKQLLELNEEVLRMPLTCPPTQTCSANVVPEPMDSVTVLAAQLLQDDLISMVPQQQNTHSVLSAQQTSKLSYLLPRLRRLVALTGNSELVKLTREAQHAARKILQYYGSFLDRAPPSTNEYDLVDKFSDNPGEDWKIMSVLDHQMCEFTNRGTQATPDTLAVNNGKVDACTMTRNTSPLVAGESKAVDGMSNNDPDSIKSTQLKQIRIIQELDQPVQAPPENEAHVLDPRSSCGKNTRIPSSGSEQKRLVNFNTHQTYLTQLRRQLAAEQAQTRNLSSQLLNCQRGVEKIRLDYVQREAELQADLRACQDRESQLIKSNTELRNELRLADYQISQLQFRLSLVERLPSSNALSGGVPDAAASDRTLPPDFNGRASRTQSNCTRGPPPCHDFTSGAVHPAENKTRGSYLERNSAMRFDKSQSVDLPFRNSSGLHSVPDGFIAKCTRGLSVTPPERTITPQPDTGVQLQTGHHRRLDECMDAMEDQSIASVTSRSSEDASSLHTTDEMEFRSGLAQLDERINSMRRALLPRNGLDIS